MTPRDTRTGGVLEEMILPALKRGGYDCKSQVKIGLRPNGRAHRVDAVAEKEGSRILISMKWQQTTGTAEQKVPFEMICMAEAIREHGFDKAYIVLGGDVWTLRDWYVSGALYTHINNATQVQIVKLERFVALANKGEL
jgi:hypothetical protein